MTDYCFECLQRQIITNFPMEMYKFSEFPFETPSQKFECINYKVLTQVRQQIDLGTQPKSQDTTRRPDAGRSR